MGLMPNTIVPRHLEIRIDRDKQGVLVPLWSVVLWEALGGSYDQAVGT